MRNLIDFLKSVRGLDGADFPLDVRYQLFADGSCNFHSGDASYDTDHRGYWGASSVAADATDTDLYSIAEDMIEQALDAKAEATI